MNEIYWHCQKWQMSSIDAALETKMSQDARQYWTLNFKFSHD